MNTETLQMLAICISPLLFSIGGMGKKLVRRLGLPLFLGIVAFYGGVEPLKCLAFALCLGIGLTLPYGSKTPYIGKFGTFCVLSCSTLWLGPTIWQVILPIVVLGLFKISNTKWGSSIVYHRIFEAVTGLLIGICVASLIV